MRKSLYQLIISVLVLATLSSTARAEAYGSGWYGEIQASYGHEDNISRTYKSDGISEETASFSVGGGYSTKLANNQQLIFSGYLIYNKHKDWEALDTFALSVGLDYTVQPKLAYNASWYNFKLNVTNLEYKDSDPREGLLIDVDLSANKRLSTSLTGRLGYRYIDKVFINKSKAEKENDAAFDTDSHELYFGLDYAFTPSFLVFGEYAYRHGDIRSTVTGGISTGAKYDAETTDEVFDPPCTRRCTPSYAYRTRGNTHLVTLGFTFPLMAVNMDIAGSYYDAKGDNDKTYQDWMLKLGLLWNF